jgi:Phosphatidylethanolamine-binding protein
MIEVKSPAFSEGDEIPTQFTCDGENISPPLRWSGVPEEAAQLRVSLTDPTRHADRSRTGSSQASTPQRRMSSRGRCRRAGPSRRTTSARRRTEDRVRRPGLLIATSSPLRRSTQRVTPWRRDG